MRWLRPTALGALLGSILAGACSGGGFTCSDDAQCTLDGEDGVCLAEGQCAFPNPDCASGLAYPQGATTHAGQCVPEGDAESSSSDTGASESGSSDTTAASTTVVADTGTSESSGTLECIDPYEPNDGEDQAASIPFGAEQGCLATWDGLIADALDADWFVLDASDGACPLTEELTLVTDTPLELCMVPRCADGVAATLVTCDGSEVELASGLACCGSEQLRASASCDGAQAEILVAIAATLNEAMCLPYQGGALL